MTHCKDLCVTSCLIMSALVFESGCGSTYTVTPSPGTGDYSYGDLSAELLEKNVTIEMVDGKKIDVGQLRAEGDTLSWNAMDSGKRQKTAVRDVKRIVRRDHLLGGLEGFGIGAAIDGALLLGLTASSNHEFPVTGAVAALALPPAFIALGLIMGHRYEYRIQADSTREKQ